VKSDSLAPYNKAVEMFRTRNSELKRYGICTTKIFAAVYRLGFRYGRKSGGRSVIECWGRDELAPSRAGCGRRLARPCFSQHPLTRLELHCSYTCISFQLMSTHECRIDSVFEVKISASAYYDQPPVARNQLRTSDLRNDATRCQWEP
jgi:hypothetical protein